MPAIGRAQHFEWAKGFSGSEFTFVDCSVADSLGNLYVACPFMGPLEWDNQGLVGNDEHPFHTPNNSFILAKITPDGEMAWKKIIMTNMGANHPLDMKLVGDTAIVCLLHMTPALFQPYYLDFLDTLIYSAEDNPFHFENAGIVDCNALLTFDFDGNLTEKHFLAMSYVDSADNDITYTYMGNEYLYMYGFFHGAFDIDEKTGNIYIVRDDDDYGHLFLDSSISAVKFWVDGRHVGTVETQRDRLQGIPQILKFSPHLDTLLGTRHIYQYRTAFNIQGICFPYLRLDKYGHIYVTSYLDEDYLEPTFRIIVDSTQDMYFDFTEKNLDMYFLTIFDTALNPLGFVTIDDSDSSEAGGQGMYDISFDYDSNLFFISGGCCKNMCYRNTPINTTTTKEDAFILSFELNTFPPVLHSASKSPSKEETVISPEFMPHGNLITKDGRAYIQMEYKSPVYTPTQQFAPPTHKGWSAGLVTFDYNGNVEKIVDYNIWSPVRSSGYYPSGMVLHDSILYLTNELQQTPVTFGDIPYVPNWCDAVIAKYVDPAFMEPLVARPNTGIAPQSLPAEGRLEVGPNPTSSLLYMALPSYEVAERVDIYSIDGHLLGSTDCTTIDFGPLPDGIYLLRVLTNRNTYTARVVKVKN